MTAEQPAPRTEAGRLAFASLLPDMRQRDPDRLQDAIIAIEQEAARPLPEPQPNSMAKRLEKAICEGRVLDLLEELEAEG